MKNYMLLEFQYFSKFIQYITKTDLHLRSAILR